MDTTTAPGRRGSRIRIDPEGESARVAELDGLRGLAALLVLVYHIRPSLLPWGWAAVDLFFVLSGYLITGIIIRHMKNPGFLQAFYVRRGLRIWPIYFLCVLAIVAASPLLPRPTNFRLLPSTLAFLQNTHKYFSNRNVEFSLYFRHAWSVAIEEQFYWIWPILLLVVRKRGVAPLAVLVIGASVWARTQGFHWWLLLARGDGLALGGLLAALLENREWARRRARTLSRAFIGIGLCALAYMLVFGLRVGFPSLESASLAWTDDFSGELARDFRGRRCGFELWSPCSGGLEKASGCLSWHDQLLTLPLPQHRAGPGGRCGHCRGTWRQAAWRTALEVGLIFLLARLSWKYIECPILSLKSRFLYDAAGLRGPRARAAKTRTPMQTEV